MNNNRGGNNRRRGRGNNNRPQGANGGQQVNRIDSRARGNAPQMLEKYRKLANDAHLNGDRVNAEYYLQFADHYFRVIADTRVRQEEQRLRRDDRWQEGGDGQSDENDDSGEFGVESEFPAFDQPPVYTRREREDRPERPERTASERTGEATTTDRGQDRPASQSNYRRRDERPAYDGSGDNPSRGDGGEEQAAADWTGTPNDASNVTQSSDEPTAYEPPENPFLRENRGARGLRPRREDRRPRREDRPETATLGETPDNDRSARALSAGIDPETLPPSFTVPRDEPAAVIDETPAPAPRRRARRKSVDDAGEPIQSLI
ncbi:MAG: DUF4167 domain-containing protein [Pseudomonadota bacterium]|nr:DUF4167 domain-containing protein [Pseudomonadota bacterium]